MKVLIINDNTNNVHLLYMILFFKLCLEITVVLPVQHTWSQSIGIN